MFKQGDKYIHFTKYGGVNKGEVEWYGSTMNHDYQNEVVYVSHYIRSTIGHIISTDGSDGRVYRINEDMDPEMLRKLKSSTEVLIELKNRKKYINERSIWCNEWTSISYNFLGFCTNGGRKWNNWDI